MSYIDLITDNGEIVRVEVPEKLYDDCWEYIENSMKTRGLFATARFEGCKAECLGHSLDRVNMGKIIGTL